MEGGEEIVNFSYCDLEVASLYSRESGASIFRGDDEAIIRNGTCFPLEIGAGPHSGINSDLHRILEVYGSFTRGEQVVVDLGFLDRYGYPAEMEKLGLASTVDGNSLRVYGPSGVLFDATVPDLDLRAGANLLLLGLGAKDETILKMLGRLNEAETRLSTNSSHWGLTSK